MNIRSALLGAVYALGLWLPVAADAQPGPLRTVSVSAGMVDFSHAGTPAGTLRFDYNGPTLGVVFRQPGLFAMATMGIGSPTLVDANATVSLALRRLSVPRRGLEVPAMITIGHMRSQYKGGNRWDATRIGLGVGLQWAPPNSGLTVRANPTLSMISSTLTNGYGLGFGAEADAVLAVVRIKAGLHMMLGYTFQYQVWNINPPRGLQYASKTSFDYRSVTHVARLGLRF